jgi:hypothetical protein
MIIRKLTSALLAISFSGVVLTASTPWTPILAPARATDWSTAGVTNGIPANRTQCGATINPYTGTAAAINSAISACTAGHYVLLAAGTFNLSTTIVLKSNVTLRGHGMSTILNFTDVGGSTYFWGGGDVAVAAQGYDSSGYLTNPALGGVPAGTIRNWIGTNGQPGVYTQGATVLNLDSVPVGLQVGYTLTLWQTDDPDNTVPHSGYFVSSKAEVDGSNVSWQGSSQSLTSGQQQRVRVVSVSGTQVTISPGLYRPSGTWASARSPKVGWQALTLTGVGLESLRITKSNALTDLVALVGFNSVADSWISGVGIVGGTVGRPASNGIQIVDSRNVTVRHSWWDPFWGGAQATTTSYGVSLLQCSGCLIENNIFNQVESPIMLNSGTTGSVIAHNYEYFAAGKEGGLQIHEVGVAMNLYEGNRAKKFWVDNFHGSTTLNTLFRNHFYGGDGLDLWAYHRWYNAIGNVINAIVYQSLFTDPMLINRWSAVAFRLGYASQEAHAGSELSYNVYPDPVVISSFMRWGNYVTTDGTRWLASEVPSSDPVFPNAVPASQNLPPSFYRSTKPTWWPTAKPWPVIGPDVSGGNIAGYAGHAYTTPAEDCYAASSGMIANFDPATCYVNNLPSVPSNVKIVVP